jgi:hypothetical protein
MIVRTSLTGCLRYREWLTVRKQDDDFVLVAASNVNTPRALKTSSTGRGFPHVIKCGNALQLIWIMAKNHTLMYVVVLLLPTETRHRLGGNKV